MPVVETCAECGLDLRFEPNFKNGKGEYYHVYDAKKAGWYKFIHLPIPVIQDDLFEREREQAYVPTQGWNGEHRNENFTENRARVMAEIRGEIRQK